MDQFQAGLDQVDLAKKKGEWFSFYAGYFDSVEINSTFYRPPNEFMVSSWIKKAKDHPGFEYSVKMPKIVTHESMVKGENTLEAGTPASFDVLTNEIRGLGLNMQLEKARV